MVITGAGKVGIGTATVNYGLAVYSGHANSAAWFGQTTVADGAIQTWTASTSYTGNAWYHQGERANNSAFNYLIMSDGTGNKAFRIRGDGEVYADGSYTTSGADYQEFFESSDGSALEVGKSVVLESDKVRIYNADTDNTDSIFGVVRPKAENKNSALTGNAAENAWTDAFLTDDWGVYVMEDVTLWDWDKIETAEGEEDRELGSVYEWKELAKDPDWTPPADARKTIHSERARNPDYDESLTYIPREGRDEWNLIGLLGQVQVKANEPTRPTWIKMKDISDAVEMWMIR